MIVPALQPAEARLSANTGTASAEQAGQFRAATGRQQMELSKAVSLFLWALAPEPHLWR